MVAAHQGHRIVGHHIPATVDPHERCSGSRELLNHGGSYALPFYMYFRFFGCSFCVAFLRYTTRPSAPCRQYVGMLTVSPRAAGQFCVG